MSEITKNVLQNTTVKEKCMSVMEENFFMKKNVILNVSSFVMLIISVVLFALSTSTIAHAEIDNEPKYDVVVDLESLDGTNLVQYSNENNVPIYDGYTTRCVVKHYSSNGNGFEEFHSTTMDYQYIEEISESKCTVAGGVLVPEDSKGYYMTLEYTVIDENNNIIEQKIIGSDKVTL